MVYIAVLVLGVVCRAVWVTAQVLQSYQEYRGALHCSISTITMGVKVVCIAVLAQVLWV